MISFRSPFLQATTTQSRENRSEVKRRRLFGTTLALFLIGIPVLCVLLEWLPTHGVGYPLYWVHDHVFLPLKGWTFHRFAPASTIWWTLALLFAITWLIFFLVDESLILSPHRDLMLFALAREQFHGPLLRSASWLARRGVRPGLLRSAIDYRVARLADAAARDPGKRTRLATAVSFQAEIYLLPDAGAYELLWAGNGWLRGRLLASEKQPLDPALPKRIAERLHPNRSAETWQKMVIDPPAPMTPDDLLLNAMLIGCLDHAGTRRLLFGTNTLSPALTSMHARQLWIRAIERRREWLEGLRRQLQHKALDPHLRTAIEPPLAELPETLLPVIGQLALGSALLAGTVTGRPEPAVLMLETMASLETAIAFFDEEDEEDEAFATVL